MNKPEIMFAYMKTGGGHYAPAKAVAAAIEQSHSGQVSVVLSDFFKDIGAEKQDTHLIEAWNSMLKFPKFNKYGHSILSHIPSAARSWLYATFKPTFVPAADFLDRKRPTVVVSTHSAAAYVIEKAQDLARHKFISIFLSSDPLSSHVFAEQLMEQDYYLVSSDYSKDRLITAGIDPKKIIQFPFPVNGDFRPDLVPDRDLGRTLNLSPEKKTLLVSFGGQGVGSIGIFLKILEDSSLPLNVIVVCGSNRNLQTELNSALPELNRRKLQVIPLGFVDNMPQLAALSDFCFIKPGVSTTFEMMTMKKPILFYESAAHIEDANIEFAADHGLGTYVGKDKEKFLSAVRRLMEESELSVIRQVYENLHLKNGNLPIGDFLTRLASEGRADRH